MKIKKIFITILILSSSITSISSLYAGKKKDSLHVTLNPKIEYRLFIHPNGSVLNFPEVPTQITTSTQDSFSVSQNGRDVIILPLSLRSTGRLFVYLGTKRIIIDLSASTRARSLFIFAHPKDELYKPRYK